MVCVVKHQQNFLLIILHFHHRHYLYVLYVFQLSAVKAHSAKAFTLPWVVMPLSGALSSLEVTLAALEVLVMVTVPTVWAV